MPNIGAESKWMGLDSSASRKALKIPAPEARNFDAALGYPRAPTDWIEAEEG